MNKGKRSSGWGITPIPFQEHWMFYIIGPLSYESEGGLEYQTHMGEIIKGYKITEVELSKVNESDGKSAFYAHIRRCCGRMARKGLLRLVDKRTYEMPLPAKEIWPELFNAFKNASRTGVYKLMKYIDSNPITEESLKDLRQFLVIYYRNDEWYLPSDPYLVPPVYPEMTPKLRTSNEEVELAAMKYIEEYEKKEGRQTNDVSKENLGYDIYSFDKEGERHIESKGRLGKGGVTLSQNEWETAKALKEKYFLYIVFNALNPKKRTLFVIQDPCSSFKYDEVIMIPTYKIPKGAIERMGAK